MTRRWGLLCLGLGLALVGGLGCQTWVPGVGMTLPSGRYLEHPPQYIPPDPPFPLTRELARMEEAQPIGVPAPLPPQVPPGGFR